MKLVSVYPALFAFLLVMALIPIQTHLSKAYGVVQPIRKELPADQQKKRGTPLMGGLIFLIGALISAVVQQSFVSAFLSGSFLMFALIGFSDDFKKAFTKSPEGISARTKLFLQTIVTAGTLYYLLVRTSLEPVLQITRDIQFNIPTALFVVGAALVVIGSTNAINLTDGLDGLLSVCAIPTYFFFFVISQSMDIKLFSLIMIACLLAFLFYNRFPAKIIMGDTGSMAIGGSLSLLAVIEHVLILLPILFFVYFAEILSVVIQVSYYKRTGKRIFRMSPIHYHFSLKYGWNENTIVTVFGAVSWVCSLACIGYYFLLMR
ncbi:MAG: phospho-N-acetylmuramoyl-pentapeptide-transferase [Alicyclobacillus sp. RIFOXYA1_FULL_53_8]|nr:MAG: phospho-N-acetylmuramoyl-pentapeptide-transferase [Alicyclobacillus sp. RIFOXYA1_FULL_53_8]